MKATTNIVDTFKLEFLSLASFELFLYAEDSPSEPQMGGRGRLLSSEPAAAAVAAGGTFLR